MKITIKDVEKFTEGILQQASTSSVLDNSKEQNNSTNLDKPDGQELVVKSNGSVWSYLSSTFNLYLKCRQFFSSNETDVLYKKRHEFQNLERVQLRILKIFRNDVVDAVRDIYQKPLEMEPEQHEQLSLKDKVNVWNNFRTISFLRPAALIYIHTTYILLVKIHCSWYFARIIKKYDSDTFSDDQQFNFIKYFIQNVIPILCDYMEKSMQKITSRLRLNSKVTAKEIKQVFDEFQTSMKKLVNDKFQIDKVEIYKKFLTTETVKPDFAEELSFILTSPAVEDLYFGLVQAQIRQYLKHIQSQYWCKTLDQGMLLAKLVPFLFEDSNKDLILLDKDYLGYILKYEGIQKLCANIYEAL